MKISKSVLLVSAALGSVIFALPAKACTPVVYMFRHAEDYPSPGPNDLTPVGYKHAFLYLNSIYRDRYGNILFSGMIGDLQYKNDYCNISTVLSMYNVNPNGTPGTSNPYKTAIPTASTTTQSDPEMDISRRIPNTLNYKNYWVYEYPVCPLDKDPQQNCQNNGALYDTSNRLRGALLTEMAENQSVAIFFTRQGMPSLASAIWGGSPPVPIAGTSDFRSSVNVFVYSPQYLTFNSFVGSKQPAAAVPNGSTFTTDTQCFNYNPNTQALSTSGKYYCTWSGNISPTDTLPQPVLDGLKGKICHDITVERTDKTYGYCL